MPGGLTQSLSYTDRPPWWDEYIGFLGQGLSKTNACKRLGITTQAVRRACGVAAVDDGEDMQREIRETIINAGMDRLHTSADELSHISLEDCVSAGEYVQVLREQREHQIRIMAMPVKQQEKEEGLLDKQPNVNITVGEHRHVVTVADDAAREIAATLAAQGVLDKPVPQIVDVEATEPDD